MFLCPDQTMPAILTAFILLFLASTTTSQESDRGGRKLVKKVRRLEGTGGLEGGAGCPVFDGVQVYADPASCNQFYKCENGSMSLETCENGLLFDQEMALTDAIHNYCVYQWKVDCGDRLADIRPVSSPGCQFRFGLFAVGEGGEGCHSEYVKCEHGQPTQVRPVNISVSLTASASSL